MDIRRVWNKTKKVAGAFARGISEGVDHLIEIQEENRKRYYEAEQRLHMGTDEEIVLTGEMMRRIKWMNSGQLRVIFEGKKVRVGSDPEVWDRLKWMNEDQLEAIFGKGWRK